MPLINENADGPLGWGRRRIVEAPTRGARPSAAAAKASKGKSTGRKPAESPTKGARVKGAAEKAGRFGRFLAEPGPRAGIGR